MRYGFRLAILAILASQPRHAIADRLEQRLTFEQRVEAQAVIERVHYRHQVGATKPFEEAVPRSVLERKVRTYLAQASLLETRWNAPITECALDRELARMESSSRMPERLHELRAALRNDPLLVRQCLALPTLADRLTRSFESAGRALPEPAVQAAAARTPLDVVGNCGANDTWDNGSLDDAPDPRSLHVAVWTGSVMVVWGGGDYTVGWRYDPAIDSWTPMSSSAAPASRDSATAVWTGNAMLVWGGLGQTGIPVRLQSGGRYDPIADSWSAMSLVGAPAARKDHTAIWTGTKMVVWGGTSSSGALGSGGRYDPATDTWAPTSTTSAPTPRVGHSAIWTGSLVIVWGGSSSVTGRVNTGGRYDPVADTWAPTSLVGAPVPRTQHAAVWTGSVMVAWGGADVATQFASGGRYNPAADTWSPTTMVNAPPARHLATAVWTGSTMIVWGGRSSPESTVVGTGGRYDPVADTWNATTSIGAPSARAGHTAVWTGALVVVWGGQGDSGLLSSGGRYDPVSDSWTPTSQGVAGTPSPRGGAMAVWTGNEMIIWGGTASKATSDGSRYDPALDVWTPMATLNAPSPRSSQPVIWTGNEMIVWGGFVAETGARYDPVSDIWSSMTAVGAPSPRSGQATVWTGKVMIVWGGYAGFEAVDTGGLYDPATDSWTPTSTDGAPAPRGARGIWTGSEMLIWGDDYSAPAPASDARYDPVADTWTPISNAGAPAPRQGHDAVWTGSVMLVWGGYVGSPAPPDGGAYDPLTDSWTPISTVGAPSERSGDTAIWTGREMVNWGGFDGGNYVNTGARYNPSTDTWTPTAISGSPSGRELHAAVWAGSFMLVWGGGGFNGDMRSNGGRYLVGALEDNPRSTGYYERLCQGSHSGDLLTDADALCVASVSSTFAAVTNVAGLCAELSPVPTSSDVCDRADDGLMALALNVCRGRVCLSRGIVSQCGTNQSVEESLAQADAFLGNPSRDAISCAQAACVDDEINAGGALGLNTLLVGREGNGIRLDWLPPSGGGGRLPTQYHVWRRTQGSRAHFALIGTTTAPTLLDAAAGAGSLEYEVTAVMN